MTPERHSQLQEIFEAAVNLTGPERSAYLDHACGNDPALRDHLNQLLNADEETVVMTEPFLASAQGEVLECPKCGRCYETPLSACPSDASKLDFALAGTRMIDGKYRIDQLLGRGGMGAVYLAEHTGLEKRFALKLILDNVAISPEHRANFENEARALGRLNHRNIVNVTDYGVDSRGGGVPYLVMEYLAGKTLSQVLKERGALPLEESLELLRTAARAVDAAHENNIVHGDLKPSNLFLAEEPNSSQVCLKVLDFGLARLTNPSSTLAGEEIGDKTLGGNIRGTPAYMAPELLRGDEATPASDRFAFGALLYEVLTGHPPFGKQLAEIAKNIKNLPRAPSSRNPALPAEIDAPVLALLSPNPADRPTSTSAAVSAVARAWLRARQRRWRANEWPKRLLLSAVAISLAVLIAASIMQFRLARTLEGRTADQRFALARPTPPDPSLMFVSIDDATLGADSRSLADLASEFGTLIDGVFASGARAVAIDLLLPPRWSESQEFAKAVVSHADRLALALLASRSGDLIGTECLGPLTTYLLGPQKYADMFGLVNLDQDEDGTIRRARLFYLDNVGQRHQSFASRAVQAAFPNRRFPDSAPGPIWIDYAASFRQIASISYKDVPARLRATPTLFRNRLVIIGETYAGNGDEHRIPRAASETSVAGEFIQALIANTILAGSPISEVCLWPCLVAVGLACLAATAAAICFPQHFTLSLTAFAILLCAYASFGFWIFRVDRMMIALVGPELATLLSLLAAWGLKSTLSAYPVEC